MRYLLGHKRAWPRLNRNMFIDAHSKEFEGSSTEEAIEKAEKAFGVSRETLDIKIVCEEQKGLFGMSGAKRAKIKAAVKNR